MGEPVIICVCVCVCVRACMCERERLRERKRDRDQENGSLKLCTLTEATDEKGELSSCYLCSRSLPVRKSIVIQQKRHCHTTQNTATPSGNNAMKFSAEVSEVHAAARV